jgi:uncharacterized integral membrane protein
LKALLALVILLVLVVFLLSNRDGVALGFWPFGSFVTVPLGAVVLVALVVGFLAGLAAHLPKRLNASRRARRAEKRVKELEGKLAAPAAPASPVLPRLAPPVKLT